MRQQRASADVDGGAYLGGITRPKEHIRRLQFTTAAQPRANIGVEVIAAAEEYQVPRVTRISSIARAS